MRSKAHFKAHPLHPALIPFPFAFLFGAALFDLSGTVQCLWHCSQFDVETGKVSCGPARKGVRVYEVKKSKNEILLVSPP